ncbi:nucleolar protein 14 homolog [Stomoxys calcitrans]|uniref:nucleolar protein 14 homolog n=1 Tax=Stomoxys calcitrans TaxID=35570 RepID=UPI0027E23D72|nr:nucleolar protein 14 homolog [Stomoxys calcitrans]
MVKRNKNSVADAVYAKKAVKKENPFANATAATSKRLNPFEVHMNKEKFVILGRTCKHDKGLPGVSRAKAVKKRQETLGQEYLRKDKTNKFKDRRIGKYLSGDQLSEEIMNARFVADKMERMKQSKQSRFNLNDDEILTHRGQTLEEIEQFRDDRSDDDVEDEETLDAEFTEAAHFGGDEAVAAKDRKTAIEEMIIEQKRRKVEIAKEKDELFDLTEKLDSNYKNLIGLVGKMTKSEMKRQEPDDYDRLTRELIFEPRGVVADKLLSEEEVAKKEKERLERLENERLRRMRADGEVGEEEASKPKHRSADDLDDGYFAYGEEEQEDGTLVYNMDGELGSKHDNSTEKGDGEEDEEGEEETDNDSSDAEEDGEESGSEGEEEEAEEDNLSDLKVSDSEAEDSEAETKAKKPKDTAKEKPKKETIERSDLPFTIEMPKSYEEFVKLLKQYKQKDHPIIIERIIKCNHPKLEGVNREKIVKLFAFLLQLLNEKFADAGPDDIREHFQFFSSIMPHLFDLIHLNTERMSNILMDVIKEKYAEFKKNSKQYPPLEVLIYFKIVSNLCSTSDFRHPIVTPCYIFMQHILSKARVKSRQDIAIGLFLVTLSLEYGNISKRFLPAAFNFLQGVLFLCIPKRPVEVLKVVPPFQSQGPLSKLLAIPADSSDYKDIKEETLQAEDLVSQTINNEFKLKALNHALLLTQDAVTMVTDNIGCSLLVEPLLAMLDKLIITEAYPAYIKSNYEKTKLVLESLTSKPLIKLVPPEKKPKALRLLEPRIETVYDDKRRPKLSKDKEEKVKLVHRIRRETKGAIREIRRDTEFLQKMRIQQQLQSDKERREKVKRIYAEASLQQGELNALDREKKKKKKF